MSSTFVAVDAAQYEQMMGRWSRELARSLHRFRRGARRRKHHRCRLRHRQPHLSALLDAATRSSAHRRSIMRRSFSTRRAPSRRPPRCASSKADATALPFEDASFDRALSLLVLHFVPESSARRRRDAPRREVGGHRRARPSGTAAAAIWRNACSGTRRPASCRAERQGRKRAYSRPLTRKGEMRTAFAASGLRRTCAETTLTIRMNYAGFADYWGPIAAGERPARRILSKARRQGAGHGRARRARAFEGGAPDGPRSFTASAWACAGRVP